VARRSDPLCRLVLSHLKHAPGSLDQTSGTLSGDKSARERGIGEVDRDGVIQNPAHPRERHRPAIGAAVLVEPRGDLSMPPPETVRRYADPDAHRKKSFRVSGLSLIKLTGSPIVG